MIGIVVVTGLGVLLVVLVILAVWLAAERLAGWRYHIKERRQVMSLRHWLIKKLAGQRGIALNLFIVGRLRLPPKGRSLVGGCRIMHPDLTTQRYKLEAVVDLLREFRAHPKQATEANLWQALDKLDVLDANEEPI